jgi:hypothetical protein
MKSIPPRINSTTFDLSQGMGFVELMPRELKKFKNPGCFFAGADRFTV